MYLPATGERYVRILDTLHSYFDFDWYLEIGCGKGRSLAPARCNSVCVDPRLSFTHNVFGNKPLLHAFQMTSDDFFEAGHLDRLGIRPNFAFLDGLHLFEFLLRDFFNTERRMAEGGVIALHDCCPFDLACTDRAMADDPKGAWAGDVWKLIPILQEFRPDLALTILDCSPTGLVFVTGLNPENNTLPKHYDEIVARYGDLDIEGYGVERFFSSFAYFPAQEARLQEFSFMTASADRSHKTAVGA